MQHDYDLFQKIVTRLRDILHRTEDSLVELESVLERTSQPGYKMTRRIWHAFNTARKENKYMRQLKSLETWNKMLSQLRKQRCELLKRRGDASTCIVCKKAPESYWQIQVALQNWEHLSTTFGLVPMAPTWDTRSGYRSIQRVSLVRCSSTLSSPVNRIQMNCLISLSTLLKRHIFKPRF